MCSRLRSASPVLVLGLVANSVACFAYGSREWFELPGTSSALIERASFDLKCPKEKVQVFPLGPNESYVTSGVRGCGRSGTYMWESHRGDWIMNAANEQR